MSLDTQHVSLKTSENTMNTFAHYPPGKVTKCFRIQSWTKCLDTCWKFYEPNINNTSLIIQKVLLYTPFPCHCCFKCYKHLLTHFEGKSTLNNQQSTLSGGRGMWRAGGWMGDVNSFAQDCIIFKHCFVTVLSTE